MPYPQLTKIAYAREGKRMADNYRAYQRAWSQRKRWVAAALAGRVPGQVGRPARRA